MSSVGRTTHRFRPGFVTLIDSPVPFVGKASFPTLTGILRVRAKVPSFTIPAGKVRSCMCKTKVTFRRVTGEFIARGRTEKGCTGQAMGLLKTAPLSFNPFPEMRRLGGGLRGYK